MSRVAWAWYSVWTLVDYITTTALYGIYHEANPLAAWLVSRGVPIGAALAVLGLAVTALLAAMYIFGGRILRLAAIGAMWVRATPAVNNLVLVATGRSLVDSVILALNIPPTWAATIVTVAPATVVSIVLVRGLGAQKGQRR